MNDWRELEDQSRSIYEEAVAKYDVDATFVGFSGGTDSLLALHVMKKFIPDLKAFHANTGIGIEKTRQFCRDHCKKIGIELIEIRAKEDCGQDYDKIVLENGFPGPPMHNSMYALLKERCIRVLHRRYKTKRGRKIMILTGIRHDESQIRAGYKNSVIDTVGGVVWVNPVYWFNQQQKHDWLKDHDIERNPVHKVLGMSGECLCGAFASKGELELVRIVEPETADRIEDLQERVMKKFPWRWDQEMPKYFRAMKHGQTDAFHDWENDEYFRPFCVGCGKSEGNNE